ncbi:MAG TPA: hypothetical protein PKO06_18590, partial [Candidatus Ozemobacteraceae bacterium]|nr:hypothetical protein [Candidatus Ozemobacteraceae bacterium]
LSALGIIIAGVLRYSGSELKLAQRLIREKRAEYLAYAGISWTLEELRKKRWYQPPGKPPLKVQRPNYHMEVLEPFGAGNGKVTVICDEYGKLGVDVSKSDLYGNLDKADLLDHIKVFSIGEDGDAQTRAMVYGKFIMSPDPFLNSDSTDAPTMGSVAGKGMMDILIPQAWSQDGAVGKTFIVHEILVTVGTRVDPNTVVARLRQGPDWPYPTTMTHDVKSPYFGTLTTINVKTGQQVSQDDVFGTIKEESGSSVPSETLKRMVQVKRVDLRPFFGKDLTDISTIREIGKVMGDESRLFVKNQVLNQPLSRSLAENLTKTPLPDKTDAATIMNRLGGLGMGSSAGYDQDGNAFILDLFKHWHPRGYQLKDDEIPAFLAGCRFNLGTRPSEPRAEIKQVLTYSGHKDVLDKLYDTAARKNPEYYVLKGIEKYLSMLKHDPNSVTEKMIHDLSFLQNARKRISVKLDGGTPWEDDIYKDKVAKGENMAGYWWWPERAGWYGPIKISGPFPDEVPYTLENDTVDPPLKIRVDYLLNYHRKHYDEGSLQPFPSGWRLPADQNDTPQRPGPPDSTGSQYSGSAS